MSWANAYIGLPFADRGRDDAGYDCWGLVQKVYQEQLRIALPSYAGDYVCAQEHALIAQLISKNATAARWREVQDVRSFDVVLLRQGRFDSHVGVAINSTQMLHMARGEQAKIEAYRGPRWGKRFAAAYRYLNDR